MPPKQSLGKGLGAMFPDLLTDASNMDLAKEILANGRR
jgi:hypothetical protein